MKNSASSDCSTATGNLAWAIKKCDDDPTCEFIHDYGCYDSNTPDLGDLAGNPETDEGWRYCPNRSVDDYSNNDGMACSRLKKGETLIKYIMYLNTQYNF